MAELHVIESNFFWHTQERDQLAPMLFLEGLARAEFKQGPSLFEFFDLLHQEACDNGLILAGLDLVSPLQEEVLERKVALFTIGEPLFFAHLVELVLELFEHGPRFVLHIQLVLHFVVESESWLVLGKVVTITIRLSDSTLQLLPLLTKLLHHLRRLHSLLKGQLVALLGLLFVPLIEHLLQV